MKKGFVISLSTILIFSIVLLFAVFYESLVQRNNSFVLESFETQKAGFAADDIASDLNRLLGTGIRASHDKNALQLSFSDSLPAKISKTELGNLENFIDSNFARQINSNIDVNFDMLLDGNTEIIFSNGLRYDYNYGTVNSVMFYAPYKDTNAARYDINITVNAASIDSSAWAWNSNGDINVNLSFTDQNSGLSVAYSGKLDSSIENTYQWNYSAVSGDSFYIKIGELGEHEKALRIIEAITNSDARAEINVNAVLPLPSHEIEWHYNADYNYSQNDVNLNRKISLGKA